MPIASSSSILTTPRCMCLTRRSIGPCSSKPAGRSVKSSQRICEPDAHADILGDGSTVPAGCGNMVSIAERPPEASDRAIPGHWEGDLIIGKVGHSAIGVVVERRSLYVLLLHLPDGRGTPEVRRVLAEPLTALPNQLRCTLTWDQGKEMAEHVRFTIETGVAVYFCDPKSPWQRATSENTKGLLRQYFPKGTDLSLHSQDELDAVAREFNARPRQTLGWMTPCEVFAKTVALTP